ncbi:hypothetical protein KEM56_005549 [Ascosphaera pollenicola]|nr:hypothetical protein KEM56_005549 [Ascosphaera pollenicola]
MSNPISYFHKQFDPVPIDADTLRKTHRQLCQWIKKAVDLIDARESQGTPLNSPHDNIYSGDLGIAFMYLRLQQQATCLAKDPREEAELRAKFTAAALRNIHADSNLHPAFNETMLSPIGSPKTAGTFLNLLMDWAEDLPCHKRGIDAFRNATRQAGQMDVAPGQDDVMFGRSGLLWAIQYLRGCTEPFITDDSESPLLNRIFVLSRSV